MGWISLKKGLYQVLPGLTVQPINVVKETLKLLPVGARICDVGAGGRKITPDTFTVDGFVSDNTDLVCDIHEIPLPDNEFDCVFCTGTLEHVKDPCRVLDEMLRILKPAGVIHLEVPFIQGFHADPSDYWRWSLDGLKLLCEEKGLKEIESGVHIGPSSALAWIMGEYISCLFGNGGFGRALSSVSRFFLFPIKYLDYVIIKRPAASRIASGVYFVGRK